MNFRLLLAIVWGLAFTLAGCGEAHDHSEHDHDMSDMGDVGGMCEGASTLTVDDLTLTLSTEPAMIPLNELFTLTVRALDADGNALDGTLTFDATMPAHGHGMNVEPVLSSTETGVFVVEGVNFHMPGTWKLDFTFESDGTTLTVSADYECTEG